MSQMTQIPASQQIKQLESQLLKAYIERTDGQRAVEQADEKIAAIRSVMAGVGIGQKLQQELTPDSPYVGQAAPPKIVDVAKPRGEVVPIK